MVCVQIVSLSVVQMYLVEIQPVWKLCFFSFLAMLQGLQDLSSPTRNQTQAPSVRAWSPNYWAIRDSLEFHCRVPWKLFLRGMFQ